MGVAALKALLVAVLLAVAEPLSAAVAAESIVMAAELEAPLDSPYAVVGEVGVLAARVECYYNHMGP